jgi:hypothetical protein
MSGRPCPGCTKPLAGIENPGQLSYYDSRTLICAPCGWREANALMLARTANRGIATRSVIASPGRLTALGEAALDRR